MKKKWMFCAVVALSLAMLICPAMAEEDPVARLADLDRQIAALETEKEPLAALRQEYEVNEVLIMAGAIVQTSPDFIVRGGGLSFEAFLGLGTQYYIVQDPENGVTQFGTYSGRHSLGDRVTIQVDNGSYSATVVGPLPAETVELVAKLKVIDDRIDQLEAERKQVDEQVRAIRMQYMDVLRKYSADSDKGLVFQISNPMMMSGGMGSMIEQGNMYAVPTVQNGNTMVPIRALVEGLGGTVTWNQAALSTDCTLDGTTVTLSVGSDTALVNGTAVTISTPVTVENGKTMVPLRFVSEQLGALVEWKGEEQIILVGLASDQPVEVPPLTPEEEYRQYRSVLDAANVATTGMVYYEQWDPFLGAQYSYPGDFVVELAPSGFDGLARTFTYGEAGGFYIEQIGDTYEGSVEEFAEKHGLILLTEENRYELSGNLLRTKEDGALFLPDDPGDLRVYYYNGSSACVLAPYLYEGCTDAQCETILHEFYHMVNSFGMAVG